MGIKLKQRFISFRILNQGFTLVELIVAMAVSLLVIGAIGSTFLSQNKSYLAQEEVAAMQQNLRAAMFYMQREIRMAGCNPFNNSITLPSQDPIPISKQGTPNYPINQIIEANSTSIIFMEDVRGKFDLSIPVDDPNPDGDVDDPNEIIKYSLSNGNLVRKILYKNPAGNEVTEIQVVAQNIDALDFVYYPLDELHPLTPLPFVSGSIPAEKLPQIRSVEITLVARTEADNLKRRHLTSFIKCRNLGL
jgi:prepilin-type N-terminal cleavage/methylation domain-containing protein